MNPKNHYMKLTNKSSVPMIAFALSTLLSLTAVSLSRAAEDKKADPSGNWTWTTPGRNGGADRKMTLKLKVEGEKVTGTLSFPGQDGEMVKSEIENGKIKGDEVSFTVTREFNGNKRTMKYNGKITADAIKGKTEFERNGETQSRDWEAKRATEAK
jgi:hypothetical protein